MNYIPKVGDDIYVDTSIYTTHGVDDFIGGLCEVISVEMCGEVLRIEVKEDKGTRYPWSYLEPLQEKLKKEFGDKRGHNKPDHREEFNKL